MKKMKLVEKQEIHVDMYVSMVHINWYLKGYGTGSILMGSDVVCISFEYCNGCAMDNFRLVDLINCYFAIVNDICFYA